MAEVATPTRVKISSITLAGPGVKPMLIAIVLFSVLALVFVWSRIHAINLEYSISGLQREIRLNQEQLNELSLEAAYLSRSERIESLARNELGLREPDSGQIIQVE